MPAAGMRLRLWAEHKHVGVSINGGGPNRSQSRKARAVGAARRTPLPIFGTFHIFFALCERFGQCSRCGMLRRLDYWGRLR